MTKGVGGSSAEAELAKLEGKFPPVPLIATDEYIRRVERAQALMREKGIAALYLDTSKNLQYFTGIQLTLSERLHGAIIPAEGEITYICPNFEIPKTREMISFGEEVRGWHEHEDPTRLVIDILRRKGIETGVVAIDPQTPFFIFNGLRTAANAYDYVDGAVIVGACRIRKSEQELALMKQANRITYAVQKATAAFLHEGITTTEVMQFIRQAYTVCGAVLPTGSGIVLFGEATAFPHGVPYAQTLKQGDVVLVDISGTYGGYRSDNTRTYVFGEANERQRFIWNAEAKAQQAGFDAAKPGATFEEVDFAARAVVEAAGFEKDYGVPGLPHRTGHGIGLDTHEYGYVVRGNTARIEPGNCFSIEPMITSYGEFGVRLEDCVYMAEDGAHWFSPPARDIDDPFAAEA
ncbi:Xaa-Pro peptidase family protein [Rhizobiaceae bacterium BDR2-2]|uniref:Xaa-Pro peptidase family protein n=1 Tax=Ectorhizobium quercum TaxID=2965071 RepID=A0AAE3MZ53_9HYPH|nr:Xaa-Pro peptidase family protein [Ectorhizobium quercum]MCX8997953.1 Xaa-Pro peptidase family protein [Ectorhizobium quercum]